MKGENGEQCASAMSKKGYLLAVAARRNEAETSPRIQRHSSFKPLVCFHYRDAYTAEIK